MLSAAWLWIYAGCVLMLLELLAPGFVIFFFGLSAATVGLATFVAGEWFSTIWQLAAFSAFSILYLVTLRRYMKEVFSGTSGKSATDFDNENIGRPGKVTVAINPPHQGRVLIGDAEWTAEAESPIAAGAEVKVISQNNLTMKVEEIK